MPPRHRHLLPGLCWLLWSGSPILQGGLIRGAALRPPKGSPRQHMCPGIWLSGAGPSAPRWVRAPAQHPLLCFPSARRALVTFCPALALPTWAKPLPSCAFISLLPSNKAPALTRRDRPSPGQQWAWPRERSFRDSVSFLRTRQERHHWPKGMDSGPTSGCRGPTACPLPPRPGPGCRSRPTPWTKAGGQWVLLLPVCPNTFPAVPPAGQPGQAPFSNLDPSH